MTNKTIFLNRYVGGTGCKPGRLMVVGVGGEVLFECVTMERPWRDNKPFKSCIPTGTYAVGRHQSPKFGACLKVHDVPDRTDILFHAGNFPEDTTGCILPGSKLQYFTTDQPGGRLGVYGSRTALKRLMKAVGDGAALQIVQTNEYLRY